MDFLNLEELEDRARAVMPQMYFDYYSGASDSQQSARDNLAIWKSYRLLPRILVDVSKLDLTTTFMGGCGGASTACSAAARASRGPCMPAQALQHSAGFHSRNHQLEGQPRLLRVGAAAFVL